jgi:hypothetical protein
MMFRRLSSALLLLLMMFAPLSAEETAIAVTKQDVETAAGLHVATFSTLQGTVTVNLPDDMAAGDTISGTVVAEGNGATPEERKKNQDSLSGTVVEMEQQKTSASDPGGRGKWTLPPGIAVSIPLILRDRQGKPIGKVAIPVAKAAAAQKEMTLPSAGQTGRPVSITGAFDGDFSSTNVTVGGKSIEVLAESPRKLVARAPVGITGVAALEVTKGQSITKCEYRNLDVRLAAPKLDLKSGERTMMTVTVAGASGMEQTVPLSIVNRSPTVVHIDDGDKQTIQIDGHKLAGDSFIATRGLTGVRPGGFNIQASIGLDAMPPAHCTTVPATAEVYRPPVTVAYADDPEGLRTAAIAVHTGARWRWLHGGNTVDVYRDNPPMTGVIDVAANSIGYDPSPHGRPPFWRTNARLALWRDWDYFFAGSGGHTFEDSENDGLLGIVPAGLLPADNTAARIRWHTGGLQLEPGVPLDIYLRRRDSDNVAHAIGDANGTLRLAANTIIVGVAVAVIVEDGVTPPVVDRAIAELWFDGRTANRDHRVSLLSASVLPVLDRDPHPGWTVDHLDEPNAGRLLNAMGQETDGVWSYCGENFEKNIQFRLVRFATINGRTGGDACATAAANGRSEVLQRCLTGWNDELQRVTGDHRPALMIAVPAAYPTRGIAQAWATGAVVSQEALSGGYGRNTIAHEIGHVLGWGSALFNDGIYRNNLMSGGAERTLLREQCEVAYRGAATYAVK